MLTMPMNGNSFKVFFFFFLSLGEEMVEFFLPSEIMFKDPNFNFPYVYTGLRSPSQQVTDAYWTPRNISVSAA